SSSLLYAHPASTEIYTLSLHDALPIFKFLSKLEWPSDKKYVIAYNEVNHAKEWGGRIDPQEYTDSLRFTADWAHSEGLNYQVLPDRKSTRLNSSHVKISYAVFCLTTK